MRKVINLVLILITLILTYWLYASIREPIAFHSERDKRKDAVIAVLKKIQITQDVYRMVTGKYASSFDSLASVINNGKIEVAKLEADPSDPTNQDKFIKTVSYTPAKDSLYSLLGNTINVDSLRYIPYGGGKTFEIAADTLTHQNSLVNVLQVGTRYKEFMGEFANPSFKKYDKFYDPEKLIKFGDMNSPNTNGNW
jgi:type I restriction-modification system DNA methylase subunit